MGCCTYCTGLQSGWQDELVLRGWLYVWTTVSRSVPSSPSEAKYVFVAGSTGGVSDSGAFYRYCYRPCWVGGAMNDVFAVATALVVAVVVGLAIVAFSLLMLVGIRSLWRDLRDG